MTHVYIVNRDLTNVAHMMPVLVSLKGVTGITIVDTGSTNPNVEKCYGTLMRQYSHHPNPRFQILRVKNDGPKTPFQYLHHSAPHFVVTDGDLCIGNFHFDAVERMAAKLDSDPSLIKVGASLKISDLTATGDEATDVYRYEVVRHEQQFWNKPVGDDFYSADIDTTFAVYRSSNPTWGGYGPALRDGRNRASHLPWYSTPGAIDLEYLYYLKHVGDGKGHTHWTRYLIETAVDKTA